GPRWCARFRPPPSTGSPTSTCATTSAPRSAASSSARPDGRKNLPAAAFISYRVAPGGGAALPYLTLVGVIVTFPDGTRVRASSIAERRIDDPERTFGLYLDPRWNPTWPADVLARRDSDRREA